MPSHYSDFPSISAPNKGLISLQVGVIHRADARRLDSRDKRREGGLGTRRLSHDIRGSEYRMRHPPIPERFGGGCLESCATPIAGVCWRPLAYTS